MNKDATPFIPGKNLNAKPFIPGQAPSLSANAPSFTPPGAATATATATSGNNTNFGQQQQGPGSFNGGGRGGYNSNNNNNYQQQQGRGGGYNNVNNNNYNNNGYQQQQPQQMPPPNQYQPQQQAYQNQPPQNPYNNTSNNFQQQQGYNNNNNNNQYRNNNNNNNNNNNSRGGYQNQNQQQQQQYNQNQNNQGYQQNNNNNNNNNNNGNYSNNNNYQRNNNNQQGHNNNNNNNQNQNQQRAQALQVPLSVEQARTLLPQGHRPLVFLFLGPRGSGKSTQAKLLAQRLNLPYFSSGAAVTEEKREPFLALVEALENALSPKKKEENENENNEATSSTLRGIVLDRVIANGTVDSLFLLNLLHNKFGVQLDMTVVLNGDYLTAQERAEDRDKDNEKKNQVGFAKRMAEHGAVYDATENILQPYGGLVNITVNAGDGIEQVAKNVNDNVDKYLIEVKTSQLGNLRTRAFPRLKLLKVGTGIHQDADVETWLKARDQIHTVCGTPAHKFANFPGSNVGAVVDSHTLQETVIPYANKMFVTYKADGIRVLLVRTHDYGTFLVTAKFLCRFTFDEVEKYVSAQKEDAKQTKVKKPDWFPLGLLPTTMFEKNTVKLQDPTTKEDREADMPHPFKHLLTSGNVSHIIDAELVNFEGNDHLTKEEQAKLPPWRIYCFDCLVSNGRRMHSDNFNMRYRAISQFLDELDEFEYGRKDSSDALPASERRIVIKPIQPVVQVKELLRSIPEFPIDGLLIQQPSKYTVPRDTRNFKWKIPSQCTVDFRLSNGFFDEDRKIWMFIPCVIGFRKDETVGAAAVANNNNNNNANSGAYQAAPDQHAKRDEVPFERALIEIPDSEIGNFCDGSIAECVQLRENPSAKFVAKGAGAAAKPSNNQKLSPAQQATQQLLQNHPLSQALTPLIPPVKRKVPGFYGEFWKARGGGLQSSDQQFITADVSLWEVVRDRTADKPTPNLEEVALATAHMRHVSLEDFVNAVASKR